MMLLAVPLLPLLAALAALALPQRRQGAAGPLVAAAAGLSLALLLALHGRTFTLDAGWFASGGRMLALGLELNGLTWTAALLAAAVAFAVTLYAIGYMAGETLRARFFAELSLFIGAMLTLMLAKSLVLLFAAWEIVGLASYLLIGFHQREQAAAAAAARAFLMTRIGDVGFLAAWLLVFVQLGTTDIDALLASAAAGKLGQPFATLLALLFFGAAVGKSAQLPLSLWLPEAMVAPTPVSALLHSAAMVAAGVYLLLRLYPLLAAAPDACAVILWLGFATALFAALLAAAEMDLKRVLAWSTVSQLGEMMIAIGLGAPLAAALHLVAHACFKSTLFMGAGAIDKYAGTRDLRRIGGLRHALPVTALCMVIGALALAGIEPLLTETSHDAILAAALHAGPITGAGVLALLLLAGGYIGRALTAALAGALRAPQAKRNEVTRTMQSGMLLTAAASALITLPVIALPSVLPFGQVPPSSGPAHAAALLAGAAGLMLGAASVRYRGAAPLLGAFPLSLQQGLAAATHLPVRAALAAAAASAALERGLDRAVRGMADAISAAAGGGAAAWSLNALERGLDAAASSLAAAARAAAGGSERSERDGFHAAGERLARWLQYGGERTRSLQSGKLYLYTLGLFAWTLAVLLAAGLAFLS